MAILALLPRLQEISSSEEEAAGARVRLTSVETQDKLVCVGALAKFDDRNIFPTIATVSGCRMELTGGIRRVSAQDGRHRSPPEEELGRIQVQRRRRRLAFIGISAVSISGYVPLVRAQEPNLLISDSANFLDAGLTALGLITTIVTTILRRRLDAETNTRDLLTLLRGQQQASVKILDVYAQHSLSQVLALVEENSITWAQQLFSYYGATTGKNTQLMPVAWVCPPATNCTCNLKCKCLRLVRVEGVCEHLITVAPGSVFRIDDTYDAIICASCANHKCHGSQNSFYQNVEGGRLGSLGPQIPFNTPCRTLRTSVADVFAEEGHTGLMLLEPANDESVTWANTILEASSVKDAEERGNENPFTVSYRKALAGELCVGTWLIPHKRSSLCLPFAALWNAKSH